MKLFCRGCFVLIGWMFVVSKEDDDVSEDGHGYGDDGHGHGVDGQLTGPRAETWLAFLGIS